MLEAKVFALGRRQEYNIEHEQSNQTNHTLTDDNGGHFSAEVEPRAAAISQ